MAPSRHLDLFVASSLSFLLTFGLHEVIEENGFNEMRNKLKESSDDLASAALNRDGLRLRSLVQDLIRESPRLSEYPQPQVSDTRLLIVAAALVELLAERTGQLAPSWVATVGAMPEPTFLVAAADRLLSMRQLCEEESPEPLRKRGLFAPPQYLTWA